MYRNEQKLLHEAGGNAYNQVFLKDTQLLIIPLNRMQMLPSGKKATILAIVFIFHFVKFYSIPPPPLPSLHRNPSSFRTSGSLPAYQ